WDGPNRQEGLMPVRALALALLATAALSFSPSRSAADDSPAPGAVPAPEVSVTATPAAPALATVTRASSDSLTPEGGQDEARDAVQAAWTQRQVGDFDQAVRIADHALIEIEAVLAGDMDAARRRDLQDLRGRLTGIREAAKHDLEKSAAEDTPDAKVLS